MPALYSKKPYVENGTYHIFNRGVDKRKIFMCDKDYRVFMNILKECLLPKEALRKANLSSDQEYWKKIIAEKRNSYSGEITLLNFVLMQNHFHLLVKQKSPRIISQFMKSIQVRYSLYFNKKYERVGALFQGKYRGILIHNDAYLLTVSRYIHRNPLEILRKGASLRSYSYSSYSTYCGDKKLAWVDTRTILTMFDLVSPTLARQRYLDFVELE